MCLRETNLFLWSQPAVTYSSTEQLAVSSPMLQGRAFNNASSQSIWTAWKGNFKVDFCLPLCCGPSILVTLYTQHKCEPRELSVLGYKSGKGVYHYCLNFILGKSEKHRNHNSKSETQCRLMSCNESIFLHLLVIHTLENPSLPRTNKTSIYSKLTEITQIPTAEEDSLSPEFRLLLITVTLSKRVLPFLSSGTGDSRGSGGKRVHPSVNTSPRACRDGDCWGFLEGERAFPVSVLRIYSEWIHFCSLRKWSATFSGRKRGWGHLKDTEADSRRARSQWWSWQVGGPAEDARVGWQVRAGAAVGQPCACHAQRGAGVGGRPHQLLSVSRWGWGRWEELRGESACRGGGLANQRADVWVAACRARQGVRMSLSLFILLLFSLH